MARTTGIVKPASQDLLHLTVLRAEQLAPHWMRITLGGGDIGRFTPMGYDQWFRIFLPLGGDEGLERIPARAHRIFGYLKYLRIPDGVRPVMRNYTVRAFRPRTPDAGAELDVDFVLHGTGPTAGPASRWAAAAQPGESVVLIDEGLRFNPERGVDRVLLVGDETAVPAIAGICGSLPATATGTVIVEVPTADDVLEFPVPDGVEVHWIARDGDEKPGARALAALYALPTPASGTHAYIAGEQELPTSARRHLVAQGMDKHAISFVGYWRAGVASPAPKSQQAVAAEH